MALDPCAAVGGSAGGAKTAQGVPKAHADRLRRIDEAYGVLSKRYGIHLGRGIESRSPHSLQEDGEGHFWALWATGDETPTGRREYVVLLNPDLSERRKITLESHYITKRGKEGEYREVQGYLVTFGRLSRSVAIQEVRATRYLGGEAGQVDSVRLRLVNYSGKTILDELESTCLSKCLLCRDGRRYTLLIQDIAHEDPRCGEASLEFREIRRGIFANSSKLLKRVPIKDSGGLRVRNSVDGAHVVVTIVGLEGVRSSFYDYNGDPVRGGGIVAEEE